MQAYIIYMRRFVIGDIHGSFDKLLKVLDIVDFSSDDILYGVGDYCDRGSQNLRVLNYLMALPNFRGVFGNHDVAAYYFLTNPQLMNPKSYPIDTSFLYNWKFRGGDKTIDEFKNLSEEKRSKIIEWYENLPFEIELNDVIIKHSASINTLDPLYKNLTLKEAIENRILEDAGEVYDDYIWDRSADKYFFSPRNTKYCIYGETFIEGEGHFNDLLNTNKWTIYGHTPHINSKPLCNEKFKLINIDCGAFVDRKDMNLIGQLAILNINTFEWFKSNGESGKL